MTRGYFWQHLSEDVVDEFEACSIPSLWDDERLAAAAWEDGKNRMAENKAAVARIGEEWQQRLVSDARQRAQVASVQVQLKQKMIEMTPTQRALADRAAQRVEARKRKRGMKENLQDTREGLNLHFAITARAPEHMQVAGEPPKLVEVDGYVRTGTYLDGRLGELFITVSKGVESFGPGMDAWAIACSVALQYGVPVDKLFQKFVGHRAEPSGPVTGVRGIAKCTSPFDIVSRWLLDKYATPELMAKYQSLLSKENTYGL